MRLGVIAVLLLLAACTAAGGPPAAIPAPMAEVIPRPPVSVAPLIWQPGHWNWTGNSFVWIPGQYVDRPGIGGTWVSEMWERTAAGWVWRPGHWL